MTENIELNLAVVRKVIFLTKVFFLLEVYIYQGWVQPYLKSFADPILFVKRDKNICLQFIYIAIIFLQCNDNNGNNKKGNVIVITNHS